MGRLLREFCKKTEKEAKRLKKWLTRGNNFDNMNKLSRRGGAEKGAHREAKKNEKKFKKAVDKSGDMRYTKKARQERARPKEAQGFRGS